jgi:hypothetical protein
MEVNMADTNKKANNAEKEERVLVTLPLKPGYNANQDEFFFVNDTDYMIRCGEEVEIPKALEEVIRNSQKAKAAAFRYVNNLTEKYNSMKDKLT